MDVNYQNITLDHAMNIFDNILKSTDNYLQTIFADSSETTSQPPATQPSSTPSHQSNLSPEPQRTNDKNTYDRSNNNNNYNHNDLSTQQNDHQQNNGMRMETEEDEKLILSRELLESLNIQELKMIMESYGLDASNCIDRLDHINALEASPLFHVID
jgi:hypothetical protein